MFGKMTNSLKTESVIFALEANDDAIIYVFVTLSDIYIQETDSGSGRVSISFDHFL